jgi:hypothetical protein
MICSQSSGKQEERRLKPSLRAEAHATTRGHFSWGGRSGCDSFGTGTERGRFV